MGGFSYGLKRWRMMLLYGKIFYARRWLDEWLVPSLHERNAVRKGLDMMLRWKW